MGAVYRQLLVVASVLLALITGTVAWEAWRIEQDRIAQFRLELLHLSEILDETLSQQLQSLDSVLLILRAQQQDGDSDLARMVALMRQGPLQGVDVHVNLIGRDGRIEFSDIPGAAGESSRADSPQFLAFAKGGADQLYIGDPVLERSTRHWVLPLARPLLAADGSFRGVVEVLLPPEQLTRFLQPLDIGADTIMSVVSMRGQLLSRSVDLERHRDTRLSEEQLLELRQQRSGFRFAPSLVDQVERGIVHRWIADFPLLLLVSRTPELARAEVSASQSRLLLVGGTAAVLVLAALAGLARALAQRRLVETSLRDAHHRLQEAQRIAQFGSWEYELASGQLHLSDEACRIFSLDPDTPASELFQRAVDRIHPEDRETARRIYLAAVRTQASYDFNHRLLRADGRECWVHARGRVSVDDQGQPVSVAGTVQDISERRRQEAEREALNREKLLLLESTGEGIYGIDTEGRCTFINQAGARMLGYQVDELIGRSIHELTQYQHADGRHYPAADCPVFHASISGASCRHDDEVFWHKNGQPLAVEYAAHPVRDGDRVSGTVVTFSDISRRKLAELELRIAEAAFQTQEGMFVTDAQGCILRVNSAFTEITGYTAAEIVGKNPRERSSGRQDADFYAAMWARIKATGAWKGELWNRRKNGEIYPESVTITAVMGDAEHVTHYVATMHDISERKAAEEKIRSLAFVDALTQLPNRRLLMDRLQQAQAGSARSKASPA